MEASRRTFYLGRYNCVEQLGSGPLGETFRAKIYGVAGFEKQFAVKRLFGNLTGDDAFVARFVPAASAFAALDHQRIARVHEVNAQGAHYYIVIDLIRGLDLRRILDLLRQRGEALAPDVATLIAIEIAEGLEYAHARTNVLPGGVLHLGLTAPSVMVTYEGDIKLVDVGLLAALVRPGWSDDDSLTPTLAYLAPEELRAETLDGRADLFSLGAILHELLSGSRLFLSDRASELRQQIESGPPPPPPADPRLQQVVTCALSPNRDMRFGGAAEMRAALQAILGGRADRARSDLSALVRRLAAPRERRTGAFAAVTLPTGAVDTLTPVGPAKPPPIPSHVWAPPVPKPPIGPMLSPVRTHNTLAGLGPDDAVLTPIELVELPGLPTEKAMEIIAPEEIEVITTNGSSTAEKSAAPETAAVPAATAASAAAQPPPTPPPTPAPASATEPSWTPPVVAPPPPSPEPVFAEPKEETPAPVEPPSSPVPLAKLPPRKRGSWPVFALVGALLLAGGIAIYLGVASQDAKRSSPRTTAESATQAPATSPKPLALVEEPAAKPKPAETPTAAEPRPAPPPSSTPVTRSSQPPPATTSAPAGSTATPAPPASTASTSAPAASAATAAPAATSGIEIDTTPAGANVYVDGEPQGATPAHINVAPGKHHIVIAAEHQKLINRDVELRANQPLQITLEPAKLSSEVAGDAGLKIRCKTQHELRIFVDGEDSGLDCPNDERISVAPGSHKIGLYSPRTDETHELEHDVVDGTNSTRVYTRY